MDWFHSLSSISAAELRALPRQRYLTPLIRVLYENVIRDAASGKRMHVAQVHKFNGFTHGGWSDAFREFLGVYTLPGMALAEVPPEQVSGLRLAYRELTQAEMDRLPEFLAAVKAELSKRLPDCALIPVCTSSGVRQWMATLTVTW